MEVCADYVTSWRSFRPQAHSGPAQVTDRIEADPCNTLACRRSGNILDLAAPQKDPAYYLGTALVFSTRTSTAPHGLQQNRRKIDRR